MMMKEAGSAAYRWFPAVRETKRSGPRLVAFFGLMCFAGLRPEEAAVVRKHTVSLPEMGWGKSSLRKRLPTPARTGPTTVGNAIGGSLRTGPKVRGAPFRALPS